MYYDIFIIYHHEYKFKFLKFILDKVRVYKSQWHSLTQRAFISWLIISTLAFSKGDVKPLHVAGSHPVCTEPEYPRVEHRKEHRMPYPKTSCDVLTCRKV